MRRVLPVVALVAACSKSVEPGGDPGSVVLHRLNRAEYNNTVRDLFGTTLRPADAFPADDFSVGFDNIAAALTVSSLHFELYENASDDLLDELFAFGSLPSLTVLIEAEGPDARPSGGGEFDEVAWALFTEGDIEATIWADTTADHLVGVDAYGVQAGPHPVRLALLVDGAEVATFDVPNEGSAERYEVRTSLTAGRHTLAVAFLEDFQAPPDLDRTLVVDRFAVTGPLDVPRSPAPGYGRVVTCDPADIGEGPCAEQIVRTFGRRAFRRPLSEAEVADRIAHYSEARGLGGSWDEGVRAALKSLLLSPWFVYRSEPDPIDGPRPLNSYELASRLSYFLWSSTPDDRLLDLADGDKLADAAVLEAEARRMLADPRAEALVDNLAGQWLGIRKIDEAAPSRDAFPTWDDGLRASMKDEMTLFVSSILLEDRSALDLFSADTTFVDARLATHYGMTEFTGEGMVEVTLPQRKGLLTKGAILTSLAYPTRTSPVLRGKWILENLLCSPPPPPPDDVPPFDSVKEEGEVLSVRDQLARHREDPACAGCHALMDPLGLALENYDGIGAYQTVDTFGLEVDASGELPTGEKFVGASELQPLLASDPAVPPCIVKKTLTYALGRAVADRPGDGGDLPFLDALEQTFADSDYRFEDLAVAIVLSRPFGWKNGETP